MATGGYDVIVKFGADLSALKKGFSEAGGEATVLDSKVKQVSSSTSAIQTEPVTKLKSEMQSASKETVPVVSGLKDSKVALNDIKGIDAFESSTKSSFNLKQQLQTTSKEAKGLNAVMKAFGDSGSPMLKELGATTRLGAAFTGDAQGGGMLATVMGSFGGILLPVIAIVAAIAAAFAILYATSKTFRDMIGGVVTAIQNIVKWVQVLVGDLMSGNFSKFGNDLKGGFEAAINSIKNFDFGAWAGKMVTVFQESAHTIGTALGSAFDALKKIDWGALAMQLLHAYMNVMSQIGQAELHIFDAIKNVDWGGIFAGALDAVGHFLDTLLNFDPAPMIDKLIDAIGGAFDSLFGGSGKTPAAGSKGDIGGKVSNSVAKAGPDILGKLEGVFLKLLELVPTIFAKIAIALFNALSKVDWGTAFAKIGGAIMGAIKSVDWGGIVGGLLTALGGAAAALGAALLKALGSVNWLAIFTLIFVTLKFFGTAIVNAFKAIDWGAALSKMGAALTKLGGDIVDGMKDIGTKVWGWLTGVPGKFVDGLKDVGNKIWTWISGLPARWIAALSGIGNSIWTWISGLPARWIAALSGIGNSIWTWISGLPARWIAALSGIGNSIWGWIQGLPARWIALLSGIGTFIWGKIQGLPGQFINALSTIGSFIWGKISGLPGQFINALASIGSFIWGKISGLPGQFINGLESIGSFIWGKISGLPQQFIDGIKGIGDAMWQDIQGIPQKLIDGIKGLLGGDWSGAFGALGSAFVQVIKDAWNNSPFGIIHRFAEGGFADSPMLAMIGEGGEREMIVPERHWGLVSPQLFNVLPGGPSHAPGPVSSFAAGGIISGALIPVGSPRTAAASSGPVNAPTYVTYVSVDSEDITRKLFKAFRDNEDYNQIGRM